MIRLSKSVIGQAEHDAVNRILDVEFLGMGPETQAFESDLAEYLGGGVSVACMSTGTAALHLALQACGIGPGDEVIVPSLTFVASFQAISATGAIPVACDVLDRTGLIDVEDAQRRLSPRTKAIMPVHYASATPDLKRLYALAESRGLRVVEDAAHAFGCTSGGHLIGSFGDTVCFSFDGIKNITSGEGGAVVSADAEVMQRVRDARLLGVQGDTSMRYARQRSWDFDVTSQGWRYHMSDLMAAIGRAQLARFETELKPKRIELARQYQERLADVPGLQLFDTEIGLVVPHIQVVRVLGGRRDSVRAKLLEKGIETGVHYKPSHLLSKYGGGAPSLPVTERLYAEILSLPLHPDLNAQDVDVVADAVEQALAA